MNPDGHLSSEPEFLVTISGNLSSHEPTDLFFPVALAYPRRLDVNAGAGKREPKAKQNHARCPSMA